VGNFGGDLGGDIHEGTGPCLDVRVLGCGRRRWRGWLGLGRLGLGRLGLGWRDALPCCGDGGNDFDFLGAQLCFSRVECALGLGGEAAVLLQGAPVLFRGAAGALGVAAQAEDEGEGKTVLHRQAEGTHRGKAEGDDQGAGDEFTAGHGLERVQRVGRRYAGLLDVAAGGGEEHRRQESDDEVEQDLGRVDLGLLGLVVCGFRHARLFRVDVRRHSIPSYRFLSRILSLLGIWSLTEAGCRVGCVQPGPAVNLSSGATACPDVGRYAHGRSPMF